MALSIVSDLWNKHKGTVDNQRNRARATIATCMQKSTMYRCRLKFPVDIETSPVIHPNGCGMKIPIHV